MSKLLLSNTHFLRLILETSKKQAVLLLENTTPTQTLVLSEIASNLLELPLTSTVQEKLVHRNRKILKKLSRKSTSLKAKKKTLEESSSRIYILLKSVEQPLLTLI